MKKKLMLILLMCLAMVPVKAQDEKSHILIYKIDSTIDTLLLNNVFDIYHSYVDGNGVRQKDLSTLRLRTIDGVLVYPLMEIDHIVMPKFGRIISFFGTTESPSYAKGPWKTSVDGEFPGNAGDLVTYKWVANDYIYLNTGDKSDNVKLSNGNTTGSFSFRSDTLVADEYTVFYPGTNAPAYNRVVIPVEQSQTKPDNSDHLGKSGDCGTATATRQANSNYSFNLDHKTAVLCFIPRVDSLETLRLKHIAVKSTNGKQIAGTFNLSPEGVSLVEGTGSDTITLTTNNFMLPHNKVKPADADWEATPQDTVASYMVVAPQTGSTAMKIYYRIYDTKSELDTVIVKNSGITDITGATVYPITHIIPVRTFFAVYTDSVQWDFNAPAKVFGSVNLPISKYGFIWGYNKNLTFDTMEDQLPLDNYPNLSFNTIAVDPVKQKAYYYRAYAKEGDKTWFGKVKKFGMDREIINMGTSVRWSSINMGAVTAEDPGSHYAWGELDSKSNYSRDTYQYYENGYTDIGSNIAGNPLYDVAAAKWRGCWRMPTKEELDELRSHCNWEWTTQENQDGESQRGLLVKNVNNDPDSVLFLPAAGYRNGTNLNTTDNCYYLSATKHSAEYAKYLLNNENNWNRYCWKYEGLSVRPVFESNIETTDGKYLFIRTDSISYSADHTSTNMYGTMRGLDDVVTDITQGFVIGTTEDVELGSDDLKVTLTKDADDNGSYHLPLTKEQMNELDFATKYYVRAYLTFEGNTWYGDPKEMLAMTITTDSTNWEVGKTEARLCGTVTGITESVEATTELGFVVGTTADVTLDTEGCIEIPCRTTVNGKFVCNFTNIDFKQYYYRAFVRQGGRVAYGDPKMLGLEFVDLGLPSGLKWANINIGSQTPMDNGDPYSWGETVTKSSFSNNVDNRSYGSDIGGTIHDAAQVNWQGPWRLPSKSDVEELLEYCTWQKVNLYGKDGHLLTSIRNGKTIFLPFTGFWYNGSNHYDYTWRFLLWTSTYSHDNRAWYFDNYPSNNSYPKMEHEDVHGYGFYVRPVAMVNNTLDDESMIQLTTDSVQWNVGDTSARLYGYLLGLRYNELATESGFAYATTPNVTDQTAGVKYLKTNEGELYNVASGVFSAEVPNVADETVYYYRAYVKVDGKYYFANEREFGRRTVDLGLSSHLLWSNINMGASSPDVSGGYYAWGETTTKSDYSKATYTNEDLSTDISGSSHDVAHTNWGGIWRMPTTDDIQQLLTECTWTEVVKYDQPMYKVVGPSGDSIFIAKSGYMSGTLLSDDDRRAALWTSVLNMSQDVSNENAYGTNFNGSSKTIDTDARYRGYAVRPVGKWNYEVDDTKIYVSTDSTNWYVGLENVNLCGSVYGVKPSMNATRGFVVGYETNPVVGGQNVVDVTATTVENNFFRSNITYAKDTTYYYRAYVKIGNEYYYGDTRRYGLELVDMGDGVKWASINLGAQISSDAGYRYAWGEINANKTSYTTNSYKHYDNGYVDIGADISGKASYDAVKATWTGTWRMPTLAEMQALAENCTWEWTTLDGKPGYKVTSTKEGYEGNNIFLPACGYQDGSYYQSYDTDCYYWTSSLYNDSDSYYLHGDSTSHTAQNVIKRFYGLYVRAVTTAGAEEGGGGDITGGHKPGGSSQTGDDGSGSGNSGTGDTGGTIGN